MLFTQKILTDSDHLITSPERDLWVSVLTRAVLDAVRNHYKYDREAARHFFLEGGSHFKNVCEMAGRNPQYVQNKVRKVILRKNGWNVDVPITSHYRQGPKRGRGRPKKKKLTGNSYYAAMGKKGGRPRIYNVI